MIGNATWACFDCREAVRRPTQYAGDVPCPRCGQACTYLGTKIPLPPKRDAKAWQELRDELCQRRLADQDRAWRMRVRRRHQLEQQIAKLAAQPRNDGRAQKIHLLKNRLAEL